MESALSGLSWVGVASSVIGAYLIAERRFCGFWFYLAGGLLMFGILYYHHIWSQVILMVIYSFINIKGIIHK